jgi:hypothetical protein
MRFMFLVMLTSPRILSWRVLTGSIGEKTKLLLPEEFGPGKNFKIARPAGLSLFAGILLPGKGSQTVIVLVGSAGSGTW